MQKGRHAPDLGSVVEARQDQLAQVSDHLQVQEGQESALDLCLQEENQHVAHLGAQLYPLRTSALTGYLREIYFEHCLVIQWTEMIKLK